MKISTDTKTILITTMYLTITKMALQTQLHTTNAENTSENQNKMTMMDIGQPRPIATDTWTVTKDNGSKKVVTTVTEPVYVDFMQLYGLY